MGITIEVNDRIATVVLDRPAALNAIDAAMRRALQDTWQRIAHDPQIQVVVVTGAGSRAFSAGADLKDAAPPLEADTARALDTGQAGSLVQGLDTDKPLICAFNGLAMGGGLEIGLACDIRIAVDSARFALSEVRVGTIPGSGGTQRLPRLVGGSDAMLMLLTGDNIDAAEALRIGLVSKVVSADALLPTAQSIARRILANAPLAVRAVKRLARQGLELPLDQALEAERNTWRLLRDTEDRREGREAFAQKRPPVYRGR